MHASNEPQAFFAHSPLGWIGTHWWGDVLDRLTFGHASQAHAAKALESRAGKSEVSPFQQAVIQRLLAFSNGAADSFLDIPVNLSHHTQFQRDVLEACRHIPYGSTCSYAELADRVGHPGAARAVGNTMARNAIPLVIPCHRVVAAAPHTHGGFSAPGGTHMKARLLEMEKRCSVFSVQCSVFSV